MYLNPWAHQNQKYRVVRGIGGSQKWKNLVRQSTKLEKFIKYFFIMQLRCYEKTFNFSIFGQNLKTLVRKSKHINRACILTSEHIKIKSLWSFEELAVRKNTKIIWLRRSRIRKKNYRNIFILCSFASQPKTVRIFLESLYVPGAIVKMFGMTTEQSL